MAPHTPEARGSIPVPQNKTKGRAFFQLIVLEVNNKVQVMAKIHKATLCGGGDEGGVVISLSSYKAT